MLSCIITVDWQQDWKQRHGKVCLSEQYLKCALSGCDVRVLVGFTDPTRSFQANEETTLITMGSSLESADKVLRHFCSQTHCEEGKEEQEVTMKEYNREKMELGLDCNDKETITASTSAADTSLAKVSAEESERLKATSSSDGMKEGPRSEIDPAIELARKERELERKEAELDAALDIFSELVDNCMQRHVELDEAMKRERENHELQLRELKSNVYRSKITLKEMGEIMKRETAKLRLILRKKELENEGEKDELNLLRTQRTLSLNIEQIGFVEEHELFYREKYAGNETKGQELLLRAKKDKNTLQNTLFDTREELGRLEGREFLRKQELDVINKVLDGNDDDKTADAAAATKVTLKQGGDADDSPLENSPFKSADGAEKVTAAAGTATATSTIATSTATTATTGGTEFALKQGGMSLDPTHSKDAAAVSCCSHPDCSLPGTSSCGACKTTSYCGAKCQTADWHRHKESCEGQLRKIGAGHLAKVKAFAFERNWLQATRYLDLAFAKLKLLKDRSPMSLESIQLLGDALFYRCKVIEACVNMGPRRHFLASACAEERFQLWHSSQGSQSPGTIAAFFTRIECNMLNNQFEIAEYDARIANFLCGDNESLIPEAQRSSYIAESARLFALAILRHAQAGGIPPERKEKAGEEAIKLARESVALSSDDAHPLIPFSIDETFPAERVLREVITYFGKKDRK